MTLLKRAPNRNSHKARNSIISRRADKKLNYVAQLLAESVGGKYTGAESGLLSKKVLVDDLLFTKYIDLKYNFENRFFSISYNLELGSEILTDDRFREIGNCAFEVTHKGLLAVKETTWACTRWADGDDETKGAYLTRLNNPLIIERLKALDIQRIWVTHKKDSGKWLILCESMIGSSTWMLIPPILSLITPKQQECVMFLEFFELLADAVANNR